MRLWNSYAGHKIMTRLIDSWIEGQLLQCPIGCLLIRKGCCLYYIDQDGVWNKGLVLIWISQEFIFLG